MIRGGAHRSRNPYLPDQSYQKGPQQEDVALQWRLPQAEGEELRP
jgi:hypothetical protein